MVTVSLTWTLPTTRVDGTPISPGSIVGVNIFDSASGLPGNKIASLISGTNFTTSALPNGTHVFTATVVDTSGHESAPSNAQTVVLNVPAPNPIADLAATVNP